MATLKSVSPNIASVLLIDALLSESSEADDIAAGAAQEIPPTERESIILEALGNDELTGEKLAKKAGYTFNSAFRTTVSNMKKRGLLRPGKFGRRYRRGICH